MDLTAKQRLFVAYFLGVSAGNATDAARRAGYAHPETLGRRLVRKSTVRAAIDAKLEKVALASDEVLARLSEIATGGIQHFLKVEDDGRVTLDFKRAKAKAKLGLLRKLKHGEFGVEIEAHDPLKALELLGKYHGLFKDRMELTGIVATPHAIPDVDPRELASDEHPPLAGGEGSDAPA